jgi:hypothetical protein
MDCLCFVPDCIDEKRRPSGQHSSLLDVDIEPPMNPPLRLDRKMAVIVLDTPISFKSDGGFEVFAKEALLFSRNVPWTNG